MAEAEELSEIIGGIYDAALDPALWPAVVEETCRFVDCVSGSLNSYDMVQSSLALDVSWGYDPHYVQLLVERYIQINPLRSISLQSAIGDVLSMTDVMPYEEFTASVFWREWAKPQGFVDAIQVTLEKTPRRWRPLPSSDTRASAWRTPALSDGYACSTRISGVHC